VFVSGVRARSYLSHFSAIKDAVRVCISFIPLSNLSFAIIRGRGLVERDRDKDDEIHILSSAAERREELCSSPRERRRSHAAHQTITVARFIVVEPRGHGP